jgi:hypothetical protein
VISSQSATAAQPAAQPAVAIPADIPRLNVDLSCRGESDQNKKDFQVCLGDEETAREKLAREWGQFTSANRATCTQLASELSDTQSYVELLTCLEMARDAAKLPKDINDQ